jgi:hypothetical protein
LGEILPRFSTSRFAPEIIKTLGVLPGGFVYRGRTKVSIFVVAMEMAVSLEQFQNILDFLDFDFILRKKYFLVHWGWEKSGFKLRIDIRYQ